MTPAHGFADQVRGTVIPAALTPVNEDGSLIVDALERYAAALAAKDIGGVAVGAHTGRGMHLSSSDRARALAVWRTATARPLIAAAGVPHEESVGSPEAAIDATIACAVHAAAGGADAVLVYPCRTLAQSPNRNEHILALHERVGSETGLPVIGFYLYEEAGGCPYSLDLMADLLALPTVAGVKVATLYQAVLCQDLLRLITDNGKLAITGEDRFLGASLQWGADTVLVGIASAMTELSIELLRTWQDGEADEFLRASGRVDRFAQVTFTEPMDGYVQRMLWAASWEGLIGGEAAHDPYGPAGIGSAERVIVEACLEELTRDEGSERGQEDSHRWR